VNDEQSLLAALRERNEAAFTALVEEHGPAMHRFALMYVRSAALADDVVQDAWIGVLRGIDRFEGRSSLKTWLFRIVANTAKTRALREARSTPFSALLDEGDDRAPAVSPDRFFGAGGKYPGGWVSNPRPWDELPESRLLLSETRDVIEHEISRLPEGQRLVITLRDVQGWEPEEVCSLLELSETNQRVLLHRARSRVRAGLERHLEEGRA
jgi:RNA polymerase sigma-70 factor (ECF subfamily)